MGGVLDDENVKFKSFINNIDYYFITRKKNHEFGIDNEKFPNLAKYC